MVEACLPSTLGLHPGRPEQRFGNKPLTYRTNRYPGSLTAQSRGGAPAVHPAHVVDNSLLRPQPFRGRGRRHEPGRLRPRRIGNQHRPGAARCRCVLAERGARVEQALTDNRKVYADSTRLRRGSRSPSQAGPAGSAPDERRAERFIKTLLAEGADAKLYRSDHDQLVAPPALGAFPQSRPPHTALGRQEPLMDLVNNVRGNHA